MTTNNTAVATVVPAHAGSSDAPGHPVVDSKVVPAHAGVFPRPPRRRASTPPPSLTDLAALLRRLHACPPRRFTMPRYQPLQRLNEALAIDQSRPQPALTTRDRIWLLNRATTLIDTFAATEFPLDNGLIHGDAHHENLVHNHGTWQLIDWDGACIGPRELDLLTGISDHFHEPETDRTQFLDAYGYPRCRAPGSTSMMRQIRSNACVEPGILRIRSPLVGPPCAKMRIYPGELDIVSLRGIGQLTGFSLVVVSPLAVMSPVPYTPRQESW